MQDPSSSAPHTRTLGDYAAITLKGICMGAADIVPGVSGGTMAFILGIYEELIRSIRSLSQPPFWRNVRARDIRGAWRASNGTFLCSLFIGIATAILGLSHTLEYLLSQQPLSVWSFFFGLVFASILVIGGRITSWKVIHIPALIAGSIAAYILVGMVPMETPNSWWFLILAGALAICAMILPGISGAFILLLLGKYAFILQAVNERNLLPLLLLAVGCAFGLLAFSHVLGWLFTRYHDWTVVFLMGLMIGSLRKIWPWKTDGVENIFPSLYKERILNTDLVIGLALILCGACVVLVVEWIAMKQKNQE